MKEQKAAETVRNTTKSLLLALLAGAALVMSATQARAQYDQIITPNQFIAQTWGGNLLTDTAGAYPGDPGGFYYWTPNFSATPSATMIIPLPAGLPSGWHQYNVYEWIPTVHSEQWHVVDIAADGTMNNNPTMPWAGQFGTDHQYIQNPQSDQGAWLKLGPGPQSDSTLDGGSGVWINPSTGLGAPYLQIHFLGFENTPETFDAIRVVQLDVPNGATRISGIRASGGTVTIGFLGAASALASDFTLVRSSTVNGVYGAATDAAITGSGGSYQATVPTSGAVQFYRIRWR